MNIFISSTEKGSGKTIIAAGIAAVMQSLGYNTGVYKPIQTGAVDKGKYLLSPDLTFVKMLDPYIKTHSTYMFTSNTLPAAAAEINKININIEEIQKDYSILTKKTDILLIEAAGGLMTPLNDNLFSLQIPLSLKIPVLFIINPGINSLNHYLNELNSAKTLGVDVAGVIINKYPVYSDNPDTKAFPNLIEKYSDARILGLIRNFKGKSIRTDILFNEILNGIDLEDLFRIKIPKLNRF
ncbi:MAG: dethiobiotin synthase [Candidatus Gastranaerophilales bacterium]|nr:dethiobiotin synthase [Candidatus Gastranaerophilales bacterium]